MAQISSSPSIKVKDNLLWYGMGSRPHTVSGVKSNHGTEPKEVIKETERSDGGEAERGMLLTPSPCLPAKMRGSNGKEM